MKEKRKQNVGKKSVDLFKLNTTATRIVYWLFEVLIAGTMIFSIVFAVRDRADADALATQLSHIMLCAVALVLYNIPSFLQWKFRLYIPSVLHIFVLIFIFAHFILGEVQGIYTESVVFDKILHATSGLAIAAGGFSVVNIMNKSTNTHLKLSPFFVALFSFCFALAIALLWEILEFASDSLFGTNMQRYIPPAGTPKRYATQGYGLVDTMGDVIVSTLSAFVVCVLGYIALRKKANYLNRFLLRKIPDYDTAIQEAEEAGDEKLAAALRKAKADTLTQDGGAPSANETAQDGTAQTQQEDAPPEKTPAPEEKEERP